MSALGIAGLILSAVALAQEQPLQKVPAPRRAISFSAATGYAMVDVPGYEAEQITTFEVEFHATPTLGLSFGGRRFNDFSTHGRSTARLSLGAEEVALVLNRRLFKRIVVQGRVGYMRYGLTAKGFGLQLGSETGTTTTVGFGAQFELSRVVGWQVAAHRAFKVSDATLDWYTAGLFVRLGRR